MYLNYIIPNKKIYEFLVNIGIRHFYTHPDENGLSTSNSKKIKILDKNIGQIIYLGGIEVTNNRVKIYKSNNEITNIGLNIESINIIKNYIHKLGLPDVTSISTNIYLIKDYSVFIVQDNDLDTISIETEVHFNRMCYDTNSHVFKTSTGRELMFEWVTKGDYIYIHSNVRSIFNHIK